MKINVIICFISIVGFSQNKNKWFFGAEIGNNTITSINSENKNSFHAGILSEYYFSDKWSLLGRLKYFKTGVSNLNNSAVFKGTVLSVPINLKYEYNIASKIKGNVIIGFAFNKEIKSTYYYPPNENIDFTTFYGNFNTGLGWSFDISKNTNLFMNYEVYILSKDKSNNDGFLQIIPNGPNNNLLNIGFKYNFNLETM